MTGTLARLGSILLVALALVLSAPQSSAAKERDRPPANPEERLRWWQGLRPEQRDELRGRYRRYREMEPEQRDRVRAMAGRLRLWQTESGDTAPLPGV